MNDSLPVQVVIVDDDSSVRWVIEQTLDLAGVGYVSAATGPQGIQLIQEYAPPLAIVDVKLGAMSGLDVARSKQIPPNTKILLVTGYANAIRGNVSDLPVLDVLEKPFDIIHLLSVVQQALAESA